MGTRRLKAMSDMEKGEVRDERLDMNQNRLRDESSGLS